MHSEVRVVASRQRWPRIECSGGIQARCTAEDTVHLVSAAATPLGGDTINITVVVEAGAVLKLRSAAGALALPGPNTPTSHGHWDIEVSGTLDVDLEPTVVAADARHLSAVGVVLRDSGRLRFRERVQVGRSNERDGFWSGSLWADRNDRPLLRHRMELGAGSLADDSIGAPRATISEFCYPAALFTDMPADSTVLTLAGGGTLSTWQADRLNG
ncbi:urease accessory protein UreD [Mycobacterium sherrisii]|uniref:urease accessory protein UreD n=1 Tax=Mycobacterium sherrisii TaxID=243061 RepID=UPI002DDD2FF4|nr:urease accessory protein UreD [Mycobacterium sherrisii]MEC4763526.1 urease accessory protein UreD [Mycobacterium sherrisii]